VRLRVTSHRPECRALANTVSTRSPSLATTGVYIKGGDGGAAYISAPMDQTSETWEQPRPVQVSGARIAKACNSMGSKTGMRPVQKMELEHILSRSPRTATQIGELHDRQRALNVGA
jgi:hypothetical protein